MIRRFKKQILAFVALFILFYLLILLPILNLRTLAYQFPDKLRPVVKTLDGSISGQPLENDYKFLSLELAYFMEYVQDIDTNVARLEVFSFVPYVGEFARDLRTFTLLGIVVTNFAVDTTSDVDFDIEFDRYNVNASGVESLMVSFTEFASTVGKKLPAHKENFVFVNSRIQEVDPHKYPEAAQGLLIRKNLIQVKLLSSGFIDSYDDLVVIASKLPNIIGNEGSKEYVLIVQGENLESIYFLITLEKGNLKVNTISVYNPSIDFGKNDGVIVVGSAFVNEVFDNLGEIEVWDELKVGGSNLVPEILNTNVFAFTKNDPENETKVLLKNTLLASTQKILGFGQKKQIRIVTNVLNSVQNGNIAVDFEDESLQNVLENFGFSSNVGGFLAGNNL